MRRRFRVLVLALLGVVGLAPGCGSSAVKPGTVVTGKIVKGGQPLQVPRRDINLGMVELELVPVRAPGEPVTGVEVTWVQEDGSFALRGAGQGIPPGKYKVAVYQRVQGPGSDQLQGKFARDRTPLQFDVPDAKGGTHDLGTIELDRP